MLDLFEDYKLFYNHFNVQKENIKNAAKEIYQFKLLINLYLFIED